MKTVVVGGVLFVALIGATPAFAAETNRDQGTDQAVRRPDAGPETRADVQADLVKAQRSGEYEVNRFGADSYPQLRPYLTHLREGRKPSTGTVPSE